MLALGAFAKIQTSRLQAVKAEFAAFVLNVKTLGEQAEKEAKAKEAADKKAKEKADANHKNDIARLNRDLKRMHADRAREGVLSRVPANPTSPDAACFSRDKLERAISGFVEGAATLVGRGQQAVEDLSLASQWASELSQNR